MSDTIEDLLEARGEIYGNFYPVAATYTDLRAPTARGAFLNAQGQASIERAALDMILMKIARIVCGAARQADSWRDIAGYAMLVAGGLEKEAGHD